LKSSDTRYQSAEGKEPFTDWLWSVRDKQAQAKIRIRLKRLEAGNFGDCEPVGDGVQELREHIGGGYRVYFGRHGYRLLSSCCAAAPKNRNHRTSRPPRNFGKIGNGGNNEQET
jgi:putative addiction module killer protein